MKIFRLYIASLIMLLLIVSCSEDNASYEPIIPQIEENTPCYIEGLWKVVRVSGWHADSQTEFDIPAEVERMKKELRQGGLTQERKNIIDYKLGRYENIIGVMMKYEFTFTNDFFAMVSWNPEKAPFEASWAPMDEPMNYHITYGGAYCLNYIFYMHPNLVSAHLLGKDYDPNGVEGIYYIEKVTSEEKTSDN